MASSSVEIVPNVEPVVEKKTKKTKSTKTNDEPVPVLNTEASSSNSYEQQVKSLTGLIADLTKRVMALEVELKELKEKPTSVAEPSTKVKKEEKEKKTRAPTAYNIFMKEKMLELKDSHPTLTNIERMKMAAEAWSESKK